MLTWKSLRCRKISQCNNKWCYLKFSHKLLTLLRVWVILLSSIVFKNALKVRGGSFKRKMMRRSNVYYLLALPLTQIQAIQLTVHRFDKDPQGWRCITNWSKLQTKKKKLFLDTNVRVTLLASMVDFLADIYSEHIVRQILLICKNWYNILKSTHIGKLYRQTEEMISFDLSIYFNQNIQFCNINQRKKF